jgi:hypothetical protein
MALTAPMARRLDSSDGLMARWLQLLEEFAWTCSDTRIRPSLTLVLTGPNGRIGGLKVTAYY